MIFISVGYGPRCRRIACDELRAAQPRGRRAAAERPDHPRPRALRGLQLDHRRRHRPRPRRVRAASRPSRPSCVSPQLGVMPTYPAPRPGRSSTPPFEEQVADGAAEARLAGPPPGRHGRLLHRPRRRRSRTARPLPARHRMRRRDLPLVAARRATATACASTCSKDRGWTIHRVWSTDWFHRREATLARLLERLEAARRDTPPPAPPPTRARALGGSIGGDSDADRRAGRRRRRTGGPRRGSATSSGWSACRQVRSRR